MDTRDRKHLLKGVSDLAGSATYRQISIWAEAHGGTEEQEGIERTMESRVRSLHDGWQNRRKPVSTPEHDHVRKGPLGGRCDSLGQIMVKVTGISATDVEKSSLVVRPSREKEGKLTAPQHEHGDGSRAKSTEVQPAKNCLGNTISYGHDCLNMKRKSERTGPQDPVDNLTVQIQKAGIADDTSDKESTALAIPILVGEYKRSTDETGRRETGTNQLGVYLTAAVKYLEAIGITGVPVYGVQMEGPIAVFSAAVIKGEYRVCTVIVYVLTDG